MSALRRLLAFASIVEVATGLALMLVPVTVVTLLLGVNPTGEALALALARFVGIALLALGVACWPGPAAGTGHPPVLRGLLLYNVLVALFLASLSLLEHMTGVLLWPAAVLHAVVAVLLLWQMKRPN
jgi:hypothetical protein